MHKPLTPILVAYELQATTKAEELLESIDPDERSKKAFQLGRATFPLLNEFRSVSLQVGERSVYAYEDAAARAVTWLYDLLTTDPVLRDVLPHSCFVGFDVRTFAKILGLKAIAMGKPLPPQLWYASDYRDVDTLIRPKEISAMPLTEVMSTLNIPYPDGWVWPCANAAKDMHVVAAIVKASGVFGDIVLPQAEPEAPKKKKANERCSPVSHRKAK